MESRYEEWLQSKQLCNGMCHFRELIHLLRDIPVIAWQYFNSGGATVAISIVLSSLSVGVLLAAFLTYCCCVRKRRGKSNGQAHLTSSGDTQPAPAYDEVGAGGLKVKENVAYGPVDTLEMKQNPSYGPVGH